MSIFLVFFKELYYYIKLCLQSPCKWMLICYALWVYRVGWMPAAGAGFAQLLEIATIFIMLFFAFRWNQQCISWGLFKTGWPVLSISIYLLLGMVSTVWSYKPDYSLFMSFEKLAFLAVFFAIFTIPQKFIATEKLVLFIMFSTVAFNWISPRVLGIFGIMGHDLPEGSCSAMCLSYCVGEMLANRVSSPQRLRMLHIVAAFCVFFLFTSTSGGANASAALGVAIAFAVSGKFAWGLVFAICGSALLLNEDLYNRIFGMLMQGKSDNDIQSATGRTSIWEAMMPIANQKPLLGWGYAAMERLMSDRHIMLLTDIHSNFYGSYGGTGIIGLALLIFHHAITGIISFARSSRPGFVGVFCAICCGTLNGYSYGYLAGKTAIISVFYLAFVMLTFVYYYTPVEDEYTTK